MKKMTIAFLAATLILSGAPAFAGNKNTNTATSGSSSSSKADARNYNSMQMNDRLQGGNVSSFGGGACPEGLSASFPGGGVSFQVQCKPYKQQLKYGVVKDAFGKDGGKRWLCQNDKEVYSLPDCRRYRTETSGRK